jgi:DNA-directed RNA polymerase sigma subunit (sigma70/sigma32)
VWGAKISVLPANRRFLGVRTEFWHPTGLGDGKPKTLEEIGRGLAVPRERVRQIESAALKRVASMHEMQDVTDPRG